MSVVNIASRNLPEADHDHLARAGRVAVAPADPRACSTACPRRIAEVARRDRGGDSRRWLPAVRVRATRATLARVHAPAGAEHASDRRAARRRSRRTGWSSGCGAARLVSISRPEDLPREAICQPRAGAPIRGRTRSSACRPRPAGQVVCALVVDGGRVPRRWPAALVERLQLLSEILARGAAARPPRDGAARQRHGDRAAQCPARSRQRAI